MELELSALIDAHVHLRQDDLEGKSKGMLSRIAHYSGRVCDHVIAMPNTKPPIHDPDHIAFMREQYEKALDFPTKVHMVAKWLPRTTPEDVKKAKAAGVIGYKLYPQGATTNAEDGMPFELLRDMGQQVSDVIGEMEKQGLVLMCHGEAPGFVLDREHMFLPWFYQTVYRYPGLRMTLEHITTKSGVEMICRLGIAGHKVLGTITLHHLMRTLDNVIGGKLDPDEFCMPIPKRPEDRDTLLEMALDGDQKFFALGSDSAPHDPSTKYCKGGCAGVFTAPVLAQSLVEIFEKHDRIDVLDRFTVGNAAAFYELERSGRKVVLDKHDNVVPATAGLVTSFRGLEKIPWALK